MAHFEVYGREYPAPTAFRFGDPVLIQEVTGLTWTEFDDRINSGEDDPVTALGMFAVAVWQTNPRWRRDRVARFAEAIPMGDVKLVGDDEDEADAVPPPTNGSASDADSTSKSEKQADTTSGANPASTTPHGSPTTIPESD